MRVIDLSTVPSFQAVQLLLDPGHIAGPVIIPNAARVKLKWNLGNGKSATNVTYAQWNGTPGLTTTLADTIKASLTSGATGTAFLAQLSSTTTLAAVTLQDARVATTAEVSSVSAATPGTGAGGTPDEVAIVITLRTANRGPSGRGRLYLAGLATTTFAAGNVIAPATITALNNWATTNLLPAYSSNLGPMVLGLPHRNAYTSPSTGRVFPDRPATTVTVTTALVRNNTWDTQRRRGLK